jgi:hypothetical protein
MAFGGGMRNGGLSDEAMKMLLPIFEFDYMGSSEFEHGNIPRALKEMNGLAMYTLEVNLADIRARVALKTEKLREEKTAKVFIVCPKKHEKSFKERAKLVIERERGLPADAPVRLHDYFGLGNYLKVDNGLEDRVVAGLELDNGFLISADEEMAKKFFALMESLS